MAKQDKNDLLTNLGNIFSVGLDPYYKPQKLAVFPGTGSGATAAGNTTKTTTMTTTLPTTKTGGTDSTNKINAAEVTQAKVGEKSGGVLNQVAPLYRVPEVRNAEAALAAAVKATNGTGKTTATNTAEGTTGNGEQSTNKSKTAVTSAGNLAGAIKEATAGTAVGADWNLGEIWANAYGSISGPYANQSGLDKETLDYLKRSGKQALLGNYSDDVTALGTGVQVLAGILGLDTAADVRDLYYDITHWDGSKEHLLQTLLDVVGLIPVVGAVKYADEVGTLAKQGLKGADEAGEAAKAAQKQVYQWPAGYKPSPYFTDEELLKGWKTPESSKPSLNFTDEELLKSWKTPDQKAVSNGVEEVGETKIAGKSGTEYNGGKEFNRDDLTSIYRAVGPEEYHKVIHSGRFDIIPQALQAKQFGLDLQETINFADKVPDAAAVLEVKIPRGILEGIGDCTNVDTTIFKHGTVSIQPENLDIFNQHIKKILHIY